MVKKLLLGLFAVMMCGLACARSAPGPGPNSNRFAVSSIDSGSPASVSVPVPEASSPSNSSLEDPSTRSERSTNLSHITGTARKIQMYMNKNRHLQILPDGTVNGTLDDSSLYTILQRLTVGIGQLKIQGVATCQYLCMNMCGELYGSKSFVDECVFNETIEHNHYNTYSSTKYSNRNRTMYLALNRKGQPRKVLIKAGHPLGSHAIFARVLTRTVSQERAEKLQLHPMRHHSHPHMCESTPALSQESENSTVKPLDSRCRNNKKKKKKKRKYEGPKRQLVHRRKAKANKKCENKDSVECQRLEGKHQKRTKKPLAGRNRKNPKAKHRKHHHSRLTTTTTTELPTSTFAPLTTPEDSLLDEDYFVDTTTDWEDSTPLDDSTSHPD